jgi:Tfp pilus assembly protein PilW
MRFRSERGLTLTEVVIVGVLAILVMLSLSGFYINSQSTWLEGSSQAVTQRDATLVVEHLADRVHEAASASFSPGTGQHHTLTLFDHDGVQTYQFAIDPSDSLLHEYATATLDDKGPIVTSIVNRFQVQTGGALVDLTMLDLRSANEDTVKISSRFALYNR